LLQVVGDRPRAADQAAEPYVALVLREIRATRAALGDSAIPDGGLDTIFFGGGTPSLCPPELIGAIIEALRQEFGIAANAEICAEVCAYTLRSFWLSYTFMSAHYYMYKARDINFASCNKQYSVAYFQLTEPACYWFFF
jgi:coproporphyrinogen III oxidase-like Fe-S oxidoreductase